MKVALKLMRVAEQALIKADQRMYPAMEADAVNVPLHRSAECLEFAMAAAETWLKDQVGRGSAPKRAPVMLETVQRAD